MAKFKLELLETKSPEWKIASVTDEAGLRIDDVSINSKDRRGNTALFYASKNQNLEFITLLLNLGADTSIQCEKCSLFLIKNLHHFTLSAK